ncbi:hypothetical protein RBB50_010943 [Rhinocladiella similis]
MRTASTRALTNLRKRFTIQAASRCITSTSATTTTSTPAWSLKDLSRVSEETSPLIFHLTSDNPYHNLSIEHYLLTHSHPESRILLFYTNRPCVVIGRNQNPWIETDLNSLRRGLVPEQEQEQEPEPGWEPTREYPDKTHQQQLTNQGKLSQQSGNRTTEPVDLVRRRSGGGTVFHDSGNLNYSVIVPNSKSFKRSTHAEMVVRALSPAAARYGFGDIRVNDRNDIVMRHRGTGTRSESRWLKVSGSAYKLTRGRALHHGTLLYSSPYINRISALLRSPGRDLINAKGVESVRSPVGNLAWTADRRRRGIIREEITEHIVREFWRMYGAGQTRRVGINEITLGSEECDDDDEDDRNPELAVGVRELMSNEWRFEQTPRFDFASGVLDGTEVTLTANRAVVERLSVQKLGEEPIEWTKDDFDHEIKLHDVQSWKGMFDGGSRGKQVPQNAQQGQGQGTEIVGVSDTLIKRIDTVFPQWHA